ncbi:MAG: histidinol-phosphatase [Actinomycetota bacterium]|nr:histidinol-phosphatase [Actinomycetota bacterium]
MAPLDDDLALAHELADLADAITIARFRSEDLIVETKPDLTPVSEADRAVEQAMRARLAEVHSEDAVLGEEYGEDAGASATRRWIVDPIDGTKSYVRGMPVWATLLALEQDGELVLGVVSAPALSRRWWAARGAGAFLREGAGEPRPLRVSAIAQLADAQLCFAGLEDWVTRVGVEAFSRLAAECWRSRGFGDFWQYMLVAEGAAEIALDPVVSLWDLAAPLVVVQEAGGRFTDLAGVATADGGSAVATNGRLHDIVLGRLGS